jgi:hypothetical protein
MKYLINVVLICAIIVASSTWVAAHETAKLKGAHIEFKTGDKRKRPDTKVVVQVYCRDGSIAAKNDPVQTYGEFPHYSKSGPIVLVVDTSKAKYDVKGGYHMIKIEPDGTEAWTFSYVLTLDFDDGTHLTYGRSHRTATQDDTTVRGKNL